MQQTYYLLDRFFFLGAHVDDLQYIVVGMQRGCTNVDLYIVLEE